MSIIFSLLCGASFFVDLQASTLARSLDLPGDLAKAINLSEAFAHGFGAAAILIAVYLVALEKRKLVHLAMLITLVSGVTANLLKATVVRIRPYAEGTVAVEGAGANAVAAGVEVAEQSYWDARQRSFPSGHAATAWGLALGLSIIFPRGCILFGILAVLASLQRITSGAHFLSDVCAGASIAFLVASLCLYAFSRRPEFDVSD